MSTGLEDPTVQTSVRTETIAVKEAGRVSGSEDLTCDLGQDKECESSKHTTGQGKQCLRQLLHSNPSGKSLEERNIQV